MIACEGKERHPFEARKSAYSKGTSSVVLNDTRILGACEGKDRHPFEARKSAYSKGTSSVVLNDTRILGACEGKDRHPFEARKSAYSKGTSPVVLNDTRTGFHLENLVWGGSYGRVKRAWNFFALTTPTLENTPIFTSTNYTLHADHSSILHWGRGM